MYSLFGTIDFDVCCGVVFRIQIQMPVNKPNMDRVKKRP